MGVKIIDKEKASEYLHNRILKKEVYLKFDNGSVLDKNTVSAYVYLKNRIFINAYLIKSGMAEADTTKDYKYKAKFIELEKR